MVSEALRERVRAVAVELGYVPHAATRLADYLVDRIEGRPVRPQTRVEVELGVRGSTAPPGR